MRFFLVTFITVVAFALTPASAAELGDVNVINRDAVTNELGKAIKKTPDHLLDKLKEGLEQAKEITKKIQDYYVGLKKRGTNIGERAKELLRKSIEKVIENVNKISENLKE